MLATARNFEPSMAIHSPPNETTTHVTKADEGQRPLLSLRRFVCIRRNSEMLLWSGYKRSGKPHQFNVPPALSFQAS